MKNLTKIKDAIKHRKYLALAMTAEALFLMSIITLSFFYLMPGMEATQKAVGEMQNTIDELPDAELPKMETYLAQNVGFRTAYREVLNYIIQFLISVFIAYLFFKTIAWHYTFKMVHKKIPFKTTLIKFPLITLLCTTITLITIIIFAKANNPYTITPKLLLALILLTLYYYSQTSCSLIPAEKTMRKAIKTNVIKTYLINLLILAIAIGIPLLTIRMPLITMLITITITIPAIIFTRLNLIIECIVYQLVLKMRTELKTFYLNYYKQLNNHLEN